VKSIVLAAALAAVAAPAFAQWTATPAAKASEQGFTAGATIWDCDAAGCHTTSDTSGAASMDACRALAREVGPLTAFVVDGKAYSDARLATCNASAKH
jgi:hypothetical protein